MPVEQADPRIQTLLRDGTLETHEPVGQVVVSDGGQFYQIHVEDGRPYTGLRVTIHDGGYTVGWALTILGGLWWLYVRGSDTNPFGGEYS